MPTTQIRGVEINYDVIGSDGPWIALTPGSRRAYGELIPLARGLAAKGYRVLLHDRRNCGASEVSFDPSASEFEVWADDLHALASSLGALPLYVGGASAGGRLAILFLLRYPEAARGLLIWRVTGGRFAVEKLEKSYYGDYIAVAERGGMEAVAETDHFKGCIAARPANRERLLSTSKDHFIATMREWRKPFIEALHLPVIGASEEQLQGIRVPVCAIAGNDRVHSPVTARRFATLVADCELHCDVVPERPDDNLRLEWNEKEWTEAEPRMLELFGAFLDRTK
ncbi:alpha/beta fold hydrolase [Ancylobacter terrae]|uniref:alpha/beta fold hydrolase n=1 Tax=Ancylobacter sp. sgz301288 TaxID=3342077 RepID=UPI00385CC714